MLPAEILKKVKLIEINTRKLVNNLFAGEYHTAFKGQGMQFAEFREYVPGDDVRSISWTLTAKAGKPFIKKYEEERELTLLLAVDVSGSGEFGTGKYFKGEVLTYLAAILAFSAAKNNDQIGLLLFSDRIEHFVPPKKGRGHVHRMIRDLLFFQPRSRQTKISVPCDHLRTLLKKKATIFLLSDFLDTDFQKALRFLGRKHNTVALIVEDPAEQILPNIGMIDLQDAESGEIMTIDTSDSLVRRRFEEGMRRRKELRDQELRKAEVDVVRITSGENFVDPLVAYFKGKHK